jgi:HlyD family secretion protein
VAVPIPAVAVRELVFDAHGKVVKPPKQKGKRNPDAPAPVAELLPGQTRKEVEGVFLRRADAVEFRPIKLGISGDKYFEVLEGLASGDEVVTGPYNSVRNLADGDQITVNQPNAVATAN